MTDRAQLTTGGMVRVVVTAGIVVAVLAIVVNQMATAVPPGGVVSVCGLCHVDWWRPATALLIIGVVIAVVSWALGGAPWPPEDDDE